jgi:hypothetical protein
MDQETFEDAKAVAHKTVIGNCDILLSKYTCI